MTPTLSHSPWRAVAALLFAACTPDLSHSFDSGDGGGDAPPPGVIDATDEEAWVRYDLDAAAVVADDDPTWDLALRREEVLVNGGVSGTGGVEAVVVEGVAGFDALAVAPADGWITDVDADDDGVPELVFGNGDLTDDVPEWYDYDYATHLLSPGDRFYVVHSTEDAYVKLRFDSYYDDAGTPAIYAITTDPVSPPGAR